ncbi:MAG TPA: hypothetical protein VF669_14740 [Tepidisphaeraceae bacterium]
MPFWRHMIVTGQTAVKARREFAPDADLLADAPVWCFNRFGPTRTQLPDGRIVCIGGEHEDYYDPDFCIYNDVIVVHPDLSFTIYGYPKEIFPPTDFHTATLVNERIYIIGGLGYTGTRGGSTPVYQLNLHDFSITRIQTRGTSPGWIYDHVAQLVHDGAAIRVQGGKRVETDEKSSHRTWTRAMQLRLTDCTWNEVDIEQPPDPFAQISWPEQWKPVEESSASYELNELRRVVPLGHQLFSCNVRPVAIKLGSSILFQLLDGSGQFAQVELTWDESKHATFPQPLTQVYANLNAWLLDPRR